MRITRRQFLWASATAAAGLAVGYGAWRYRRERQQRRAPPLGALAWIEIGADNRVRILSNATEMGQGAWSALAQIACEELEADWALVKVSMAPVRREFHGPRVYGTGGSQSVRTMFDRMRQAGAAARLMLVEAAARRWSVPAAQCEASLGVITHAASGRRLTFGEVAAEAATLAVPADPPLKKRGQWRLIGQSLRREEVPGKIDGTAIYGTDIRLPGLRFAAIRHCPVVGGRLASVDKAPALAVPGVEQVVTLGDAVVVVAKDTWTAQRALALLKPAWDAGRHAGASSREMREAFRQALAAGEAKPVTPDEDSRKAASAVAPAMKEAASRLEATYEAPLLSHAQLEPMNATAWLREGTLEIWAPTQQQSALRQAAAEALDLSQDQVVVHTPLVGGGFGRRLRNDYAVEAALVAKQVPYPVQVLWERTEDFLRGIFRPAACARLQAGFGPAGQLLALEAQVASADTDPRLAGLDSPPYEIAARAVHYAPVPRGIRLGSWRSVDHSQNLFFLEGFVDECAAHAKRDPLAFRLDLLKGRARERRVLEAVAQMAGWDRRQAEGRHLGLALNVGFGSVAAQVAEAVVEGGRVRISRIFSAVDCGVAVNPRNIEAQMQGGILMALGAALAEEITVQDGHVQQTGYGAYRLLTIAQAPAVEVRILETPEARPGGLGEVGVPATAPAVANAVFAATGTRLRAMPFKSDTRVKWTD